jgi:hypothetical protein
VPSGFANGSPLAGISSAKEITRRNDTASQNDAFSSPAPLNALLVTPSYQGSDQHQHETVHECAIVYTLGEMTGLFNV